MTGLAIREPVAAAADSAVEALYEEGIPEPGGIAALDADKTTALWLGTAADRQGDR